MKITRFVILMCIALLSVSAAAAQQSTWSIGDPFRASLEFDSAFTRERPTLEAEAVASVFEDSPLEVVGRSMDGLWFEVRRPGRTNNLGWILAELLDYDFLPEYLPLTDFTTGVTGPHVLTEDPGFAVYVQGNANLRTRPNVRNSERVGVVERFTVIPVIYRDQQALWFYVNYLGTEGWLSSSTVRAPVNALDIPEAPNLDPVDQIPIVIIPPEVQLAQVERMREFTMTGRDLAARLEAFWYVILGYEIMPCEPPPFLADYGYNPNDVRELPELTRYLPNLEAGVDYLNGSIELLTVCGVFDRRVVNRARANATNAKVAFDATLGALDVLEDTIR